MVNQNWHVAPVMLLCQATTSYSKIFRPENCRNPTTLLHWHESHFNSESRKWNNFSLSKILTLELQHKHPWTTLIEHSLFFSVRESENEKCKSQKTVVSDGTPFENWSYYRLRMTKWVNILIKWQDLIKTWESVLRVSHTERQCVRRASCAHQTLITRHTGWLHLYLPQKSHMTLIPGLGFIIFLLLGRSPTFAFQHRQRFRQASMLTMSTQVLTHFAENGLSHHGRDESGDANRQERMVGLKFCSICICLHCGAFERESWIDEPT